MQKSGAFIVINHPGLEGSISYKILERLQRVGTTCIIFPEN
ncbi:hypothetical protein LEP1GSC088_1200 [Leptospira interrogans str. L1207]|nr:hypothetical protein LEP1GSC088_1200 [Leptospira interrogans str. L1207]